MSKISYEAPQMSQNLSLIKYFVSEFYMDKIMDLAHIVSPNFYFTINSSFRQPFEVYANHLNLVKQDSELTISEMRSVSEQIVEVDFTIIYINEGMYDKIFGTTEFFVEKGMIEHTNIIYHHANEEIVRFQNAMFGLTEPQSKSYFL